MQVTENMQHIGFVVIAGIQEQQVYGDDYGIVLTGDHKPGCYGSIEEMLEDMQWCGYEVDYYSLDQIWAE